MKRHSVKFAVLAAGAHAENVVEKLRNFGMGDENKLEEIYSEVFNLVLQHEMNNLERSELGELI